MNVPYATGKFLDQAIPYDKGFSGLSPGQLAQKVQVSAFPDRYDEAQSTAEQLISFVYTQDEMFLINLFGGLQ